ncbi:hypothetical protein BDN72DRAFT_894540 [Pluteus cervinus]|uniref:Uncharacterized protein n=1 Tax=Pluteus cervinus TaxID=181527 RepID=A0ACD3B6W8_9AGAR|nr:hypothetical protein BDN72DRAFT_894540 [Pluteus cervinus]
MAQVFDVIGHVLVLGGLVLLLLDVHKLTMHLQDESSTGNQGRGDLLMRPCMASKETQREG